MKVVLDANVIVATFVTRGTCHEVYALVVERHELFHSTSVIEEARRILITKIGAPVSKVEEHLSRLIEASMEVIPVAVPAAVCRYKDDLHVLGAAMAAGAGLLVTGDDDLLVIRSYGGFRIVGPADALRILLGYADGPGGTSLGSAGGAAAERRARYRRTRKRGA